MINNFGSIMPVFFTRSPTLPTPVGTIFVLQCLRKLEYKFARLCNCKILQVAGAGVRV